MLNWIMLARSEMALNRSNLLACFVGLLLCYLWLDSSGGVTVDSAQTHCCSRVDNGAGRVPRPTFDDCRSVTRLDDEEDEFFLPVKELEARTNSLVSKLSTRENLREAWVFLLDFDDAQQHYAFSILAHIRAIRSWSHVWRPIVVLINETIRRSRLFNEPGLDREVVLTRVEPIAFDTRRLLVLKNANRLHVWRLTEYDKVVFVANEVALFGNLEYLFEYRSPTFTPNLESPAQLRTALFVAAPSVDVFNRMIDRLPTYEPTFDTSDQAFFDAFFVGQYAVLPWSACPSVRTLYLRRELWDWRDVTCLHWSQFKPWAWQQRHDLKALTLRWYEYMRRFAAYEPQHGDAFDNS